VGCICTHVCLEEVFFFWCLYLDAFINPQPYISYIHMYSTYPSQSRVPSSPRKSCTKKKKKNYILPLPSAFLHSHIRPSKRKPTNQPFQTLKKMSIYDEIEIEDMTYDATLQIYHFPCPCGDRFEISIDDMRDGEDIAVCPSCSLMIRVVFDAVSSLFVWFGGDKEC
jgi:diphthamide biosynthesis protein 3